MSRCSELLREKPIGRLAAAQNQAAKCSRPGPLEHPADQADDRAQNPADQSAGEIEAESP